MSDAPVSLVADILAPFPILSPPPKALEQQTQTDDER